jgi:hypothetical protein
MEYILKIIEIIFFAPVVNYFLADKKNRGTLFWTTAGFLIGIPSTILLFFMNEY